MHRSIISYRNMIDGGLILVPEINIPHVTLKRLYEPYSVSQGHYTDTIAQYLKISVSLTFINPVTQSTNSNKLIIRTIQSENRRANMYGRVTKYFQDRGYGFIRGEDNNSYFVHHSQLKGEHIERGCYVSFKPYKSDRSDFNLGNISVIGST